MPGLSLVAASGGHSSSRCADLSLSQPLLLQSTGSRHAGSVVVVHGLSCSAACGIFPDQGSNPCPLHWQADSQPLRHEGSPIFQFLKMWYHIFLALVSGDKSTVHLNCFSPIGKVLFSCCCFQFFSLFFIFSLTLICLGGYFLGVCPLGHY